MTEDSPIRTAVVEEEAKTLYVIDENTLLAFEMVQFVLLEVNPTWQVRHKLLRPVEHLFTSTMEGVMKNFIKVNLLQIVRDVETYAFHSTPDGFRKACKRLVKYYKTHKYTLRAFLQLCTTITYAACTALEKNIPEAPGIAIDVIKSVTESIRKKGILEFSSW